MEPIQHRNRYLDKHGADINRKLTEEKKCQLEYLLYPQDDARFADWSDSAKVLSREEAAWLRERAYEHLKGSPGSMADVVRSRMMHIVGGYFPLGFIGWWDVAEKL